MEQQVSARARSPVELQSLSVEHFIVFVILANSGPNGISVFDVTEYMLATRQSYNLLFSISALWTQVYSTLSNPNNVVDLLTGMGRAIRYSGDLPLTLRLKIDTEITRDHLNSITRHIFVSGSKWQHMYVTFRAQSPEFCVQNWIPQLWKVTRDANPTTTPFTNVRTLSLDASARAAIGFRGQRARCDVGSWPLWQLFPNLQRLLLLSLDFGSARMLTTQLAISSLQELTLSGYFYESVPYMVRELLANTPQLKMLRLSVREETIYPALDWTLKPLRHAALEELHLIGNLDFIVRQLRPLECPSLSRLCLGNFARGDASGSSIVAEVSAMVTRSLCQLETLELDWFDMPSYDMVRLLIGLPRLRSVKLYFRDMQPNDSLFATLFRMSADASFLQQMDSFQVLSNMVPFESSSLVESFAKFVEDPRRGGDGPFAPLRVATLKLGNNLF